MNETNDFNSDTGTHSDFSVEGDDEGSYVRPDKYPTEINYEINFENLNEDIPDETAKYVFSESQIKPKKTVQKNKKLQPVEKKLENETSQRGYYKVCKEIENKIPKYYDDKVIKPFSFLVDNEKLVEKEYGTREDEPNGEWIIDVDSADEETLTKEISRLQIKFENVHKQNISLEKKKKNIQARLDNAMKEKERLQNELDQ